MDVSIKKIQNETNFTCKPVVLSMLVTSNGVGGHWHCHSKLAEAVVTTKTIDRSILVRVCVVGEGGEFQALVGLGVRCGRVVAFQIALVEILCG